jgi:hypothetical protein
MCRHAYARTRVRGKLALERAEGKAHPLGSLRLLLIECSESGAHIAKTSCSTNIFAERQEVRYYDVAKAAGRGRK